MKALYRRSKAFRAKYEFESAAADLAAAIRLKPKMKMLRLEAEALKVSN